MYAVEIVGELIGTCDEIHLDKDTGAWDFLGYKTNMGLRIAEENTVPDNWHIWLRFDPITGDLDFSCSFEDEKDVQEKKFKMHVMDIWK